MIIAKTTIAATNSIASSTHCLSLSGMFASLKRGHKKSVCCQVESHPQKCFASPPLMLGGCSIAAKIDARTKFQKSVADYRACLDAHPWELKACDGKRLAMEAEERAYNNPSAGAPTNVNLQSR
jgi:hypothetical protein